VEQQLKGKSALVTGASRGIGAATALALARAGAGPITIQFNSNREGADQTVAAIRALGAAASAIQADLSHMDGIAGFLRELDPKIDILVNNAGDLIERTPLLEMSDELFRAVMDVNLTSAFFVCRAVAAGMVTRKRGAIVNMSSLAAWNGGGPGAGAYAAAKGAVVSLTKALAKELAPHGIRVNCVAPGLIGETAFHGRFTAPPAFENAAKSVLLGRAGTPEEVATVVAFLASSDSAFLTGETIEINGGMNMR
jgi:3-oxoacyl-[acyl-carrier protein] reductase